MHILTGARNNEPVPLHSRAFVLTLQYVTAETVNEEATKGDGCSEKQREKPEQGSYKSASSPACLSLYLIGAAR